MAHPPVPTDPPDTWPQYDVEMMRKYGGKWIAVITTTHTYLGCGANPKEAMSAGRQAARERHLDPDTVAVFAVSRPENAWF